MAGVSKPTRKGQKRIGGKGGGSGRTHGSFTLAMTTMKELNARFPNPDHPIPIGYKFAVANAVPCRTGEAARVTSMTIGALPSSEQVQYVDLDKS